jgi:hypothetical protein
MMILAQVVDNFIQLPKSSVEVGLVIAGAYAAVAILDKAMKWPIFRSKMGDNGKVMTEATTVATTYGALPCIKHGEDIATVKEAISTIKAELESIRDSNQEILRIVTEKHMH